MSVIVDFEGTWAVKGLAAYRTNVLSRNTGRCACWRGFVVGEVLRIVEAM
jgi:hypothetical protein